MHNANIFTHYAPIDFFCILCTTSLQLRYIRLNRSNYGINQLYIQYILSRGGLLWNQWLNVLYATQA